ncbi:hypothetical protein FEM48_Zijuj06G0010200 [Ziziphus jujuba var. spinosa]|uniref:Auxin-responsive protein SAUR68-like n=1 Tax=Ziziphus jujuba var. spinosa TaxID=714518 RepID=A0A978V696_ZIZJJ|nr:hypothetical protein FEM48_Zijuj06G0010200 [Ziziphus jujuba var. spinosa]
MISLKRLIAIARKWQKITGIGKIRTISLPGMSHGRLPHKGHFAVYSADKRRFVVPLTYLDCTLFRELLRMSEEEFGLPKDGPLTLPYDSASMEYIVSVVKREISNDLEMALLLSILPFTQCSSNCFTLPEGLTHCPITVHGFC